MSIIYSILCMILVINLQINVNINTQQNLTCLNCLKIFKLNMKTRVFHSILIFISLIYSIQSFNKRILEAQIRNTRQLIQLYQHKLYILEQIYQTNPNIIQQSQAKAALPQYFGIEPQHSHIILQRSMPDSQVTFLPPKYLINHRSKSVCTLQGVKMFQFFGQFLIADPYKITSLIKNNVVNILKFDQYNKKQQRFMGFTAEKGYKTIWHTSNDYKIDDVLVQAKQNSLIMKSNSNKDKQAVIRLNDSIVNIYSLNQYKIFFLTQRSYGIINSRSYSINLEFNFTSFIEVNGQNYAKEGKNISNNFQKEIVLKNLRAISSFKLQQFIYILLNDFRLVRYRQYSYVVDKFNFDLLNINNPNLTEKFKHHNVQLHYVYPHLFLTRQKQSDFLVYNVSFSGNFLFWMQMKPYLNQSNLNTNGTIFKHQFFKYENSIRLIVTKFSDRNSQKEHQQSFSFDLQLSIKKQADYQYGSTLWKIFFVVIIVAVVAFIRYNKTKKQLSLTGVQQNALENQKQLKGKSNKSKNQKSNSGLSQIQSLIQQRKKQKSVQTQSSDRKFKKA